MSSIDAASTETITLLESSPVARQSPPSSGSPSRHDPRQSDPTASADGRSNDAEKMLQSSTLDLMEGDSGADVAGPSNLDASQHQSMEVTGAAADDSQQWTEDESHELKRVKVYELVGSRWVDQGTAFCFGDFNDNQALLIARAEADFNHVILSATIRSNDVYQRQQDTLIVWTEPTGIDYALSFQDPDGCEEVWNFIQEVQRHMAAAESGMPSSPMIGPEPSVTTASIVRTGHLPAPTLGIIGELEKAIKVIARTPSMKERVCEYIQQEEYIKSLIEVFKQAEDLESLDNLHALCTCMQTILMLNDHSMYEHILEDDIFYGVIGMLEYDPEFPSHKANYRLFLRQTSHFHQPIPIRDEATQRKIHHTYRLQFLKDVVLARVLDDSTFNVLNSCILFNQIDIINHVQNDQQFLQEVVSIFLDEEMLISWGISKEPEVPKPVEDKNKMDVDQVVKRNGSCSSFPNSVSKPSLSEAEMKRRREVVCLVQQLCVMGKNVQLPARMALFRTLTDRGILFAVQWALTQPENDPEGLRMISAGGEILATILDHDVTGVRSQVMKQVGVIEAQSDKNAGKRPQLETTLALLCHVLVRSRNLAVQSLVAESLRVLLEVPQGDVVDQHPGMGAKMFQRPKDDPVTEKFLEHFYKQCADVLFNPLIDIPEFKNHNEATLTTSRERTNLYLHLCELLASFALQHSFRSHFYMLSSNIASHVGTLLSARDKHLRLGKNPAFRFFRVLLKLNNRNLFNHLMKIDAIRPILDLTIRESRRDNLISSTCKEFFEHMRKENMKELINHCMTKHQDKIDILAKGELTRDCFTAFKARWEMNMEPPPKEEQKVVDKAALQAAAAARRWGQGRLLEAEEEDYFNSPDDEDASTMNANTAFAKTTTAGGPPFKRRRVRGSGVPIRSQPQRPPIQRTVSLGSLVDYEDGEEGGAGPSDDSQATSSVFTMSPRASGSPSPQQMPPSSPRMLYRQVSPKPSLSPSPNTAFSTQNPQAVFVGAQGDFEATLFDQFVNGMASRQQNKIVSSPPAEFVSAKRRRDDDEEDELLERLVASKAKRPGNLSPSASPSPTKEQPNTSGPAGMSIKLGSVRSQDDGGPRKIKLKLSSSAASTPSPSSTGVKDGDTG